MEKQIVLPFKVWIVEDDEWYSEFLKYSISLIPDYEATVFRNGKDLLDHLHERPDVITLDFNLPDIDGATLLKKIIDIDSDVKVLMISKQEKMDTALDLLRNGAYDYFIKGDDLRDKLLNTLQHLFQHRGLQHRLNSLENEIGTKFEASRNIIGQSEPMQKVYALIQKASQNNIIVSITGETGTGKEEVAKAIHYNSSFSKGHFVAVNMAAIPKELAESELFGHEKGSFTGALTTRIGRFEEANNGTFFLDEIGELDLSLQTKLLRVLQEREVVKVGGSKVTSINCRIVVATHRNLLEEVREKRFREDLYYRLLGLQITLPPLSVRGADILLLSKHFVDRFCKENNQTIKNLSKKAGEKLLSYSFPGNIRELKSIIELAVVMSNTNAIEPDDIIIHSQTDVSKNILIGDEEMTLEDYNHLIVQQYLNKYDNNISIVAAKLNIGRSTVYRILKKEEKA